VPVTENRASRSADETQEESLVMLEASDALRLKRCAYWLTCMAVIAQRWLAMIHAGCVRSRSCLPTERQQGSGKHVC